MKISKRMRNSRNAYCEAGTFKLTMHDILLGRGVEETEEIKRKLAVLEQIERGEEEEK